MLKSLWNFITHALFSAAIITACILLWWLWQIPNVDEIQLIPFGVNIEKQTTGGLLSNKTEKAWILFINVQDQTYGKSKITRHLVSDQKLQVFEIDAPPIKKNSILLTRILFAQTLSEHEFKQEMSIRHKWRHDYTQN